MSDRKFYTLLAIAAFVLLSYAVVRQINATRACDAKGGNLINTRSGYVCLRPDAILK